MPQMGAIEGGINTEESLGKNLPIHQRTPAIIVRHLPAVAWGGGAAREGVRAELGAGVGCVGALREDGDRHLGAGVAPPANTPQSLAQKQVSQWAGESTAEPSNASELCGCETSAVFLQRKRRAEQLMTSAV